MKLSSGLKFVSSCGGLLLAVTGMTAQASPLYSGSTQAAWSAPVLSGIDYDGATGVGTFVDETGVAACNLSGCPTQLNGYSPSTIAWGDEPAGGAIPTSTVTFTPASFAGVVANQMFELGTLTYLNGTSQDIIFGATLTVSLKLSAGEPVQSLVIPLGIATTQNTGNVQQNADFLDFHTTTFNTIQPVTFNVLEGATATAILYGKIVGDPQLSASSIVIAPGSESLGFIGNGVPAVPEPSTLLLMAGGLICVAKFARKSTMPTSGQVGE
jgi:PEP-CTERM motif